MYEDKNNNRLEKFTCEILSQRQINLSQPRRRMCVIAEKLKSPRLKGLHIIYLFTKNIESY